MAEHDESNGALGKSGFAKETSEDAGLNADIPVAEFARPKSDVSASIVFCHLAGLGKLLFPGVAVLVPLFIWLTGRNSNAELDRHGRRTFNFQLTMLLADLIPLGIFVPSLIAWIVMDPDDRMTILLKCDGSPPLMVRMAVAQIIYIVLGVINVGLGIAGAIMASKGRLMRYPAIPFARG